MLTIHKESRSVDMLTDMISFDMPADAEVLSVANQHECLCLWYKTDTDCRKRKVRWFRVAGTGHPLEDVAATKCDLGRFLGTALFLDGKLVFHVFEVN